MCVGDTINRDNYDAVKRNELLNISIISRSNLISEKPEYIHHTLDICTLYKISYVCSSPCQ